MDAVLFLVTLCVTRPVISMKVHFCHNSFKDNKPRIGWALYLLCGFWRVKAPSVDDIKLTVYTNENTVESFIIYSSLSQLAVVSSCS